MNTPIAIAFSGLLIAIAMYCSTPRYAFMQINASNPAVWRLDTNNGDVALCATGTTSKDKDGKVTGESESACTTKFKQM